MAGADKYPSQSGKNEQGAAFLSLLLVLLAAASLIMSFLAMRNANQALNRTNDFEEGVKKLMSIPQNQASPGGGVGPNVETPPADGSTVPTGNTMPNGNGQ